MSKKLNAAGAAVMALKVAEVTAGASEAVLQAIIESLAKRHNALVEKRQQKREGKVQL